MEISWQSILGHEKPIARLQTLLVEKRLPHALLFAGPDGVGKLRVARALAAAILCEGDGERPCGQCQQCRALQQDTHPDYYELHPEGKAIKTIRIDAIRKVQSEAARLPLLAKKRVIVIDDAEAMNEAAENSLLKTLEEPTGAVHFILVTCAKSSLLDTILSRCMHVGFGSIPEAALAKALTMRGIPEGAAAELAALSDGSLGRALSLQENDGLKLRDDAAKFLQERAQLSVQDVFSRGASMEKMPREQLTEWFLYLGMLLRDLLVLREDGASPLLYHKDLRTELVALLSDYPERRIAALLALVRETDRRLQSNVNQRLLLEGFFLRAMEA